MRYDLARSQPAASLIDGGRERRAAVGTGVGLGVKAAIGGIVVLGLAGGAHAERRHGSVGPVVGDIADDGVARAAVGAVGEGVAEAAVGGAGEVVEALGTGGHVGGDQRELAGLGDAAVDDEFGRARGGTSVTARSWIQASGGASCEIATRKLSMVAGSPSTSAIRPADVLRTDPRRSRRRARL